MTHTAPQTSIDPSGSVDADLINTVEGLIDNDESPTATLIAIKNIAAGTSHGPIALLGAYVRRHRGLTSVAVDPAACRTLQTLAEAQHNIDFPAFDADDLIADVEITDSADLYGGCADICAGASSDDEALAAVEELLLTASACDIAVDESALMHAVRTVGAGETTGDELMTLALEHDADSTSPGEIASDDACDDTVRTDASSPVGESVSESPAPGSADRPQAGEQRIESEQRTRTETNSNGGSPNADEASGAAASETSDADADADGDGDGGGDADSAIDTDTDSGIDFDIEPEAGDAPEDATASGQRDEPAGGVSAQPSEQAGGQGHTPDGTGEGADQPSAHQSTPKGRGPGASEAAGDDERSGDVIDVSIGGEDGSDSDGTDSDTDSKADSVADSGADDGQGEAPSRGESPTAGSNRGVGESTESGRDGETHRDGAEVRPADDDRARDHEHDYDHARDRERNRDDDPEDESEADTEESAQLSLSRLQETLQQSTQRGESPDSQSPASPDDVSHTAGDTEVVRASEGDRADEREGEERESDAGEGHAARNGEEPTEQVAAQADSDDRDNADGRGNGVGTTGAAEAVTAGEPDQHHDDTRSDAEPAQHTTSGYLTQDAPDTPAGDGQRTQDVVPVDVVFGDGDEMPDTIDGSGIVKHGDKRFVGVVRCQPTTYSVHEPDVQEQIASKFARIVCGTVEYTTTIWVEETTMHGEQYLEALEQTQQQVDERNIDEPAILTAGRDIHHKWFQKFLEANAVGQREIYFTVAVDPAQFRDHTTDHAVVEQLSTLPGVGRLVEWARDDPDESVTERQLMEEVDARVDQLVSQLKKAGFDATRVTEKATAARMCYRFLNAEDPVGTLDISGPAPSGQAKPSHQDDSVIDDPTEGVAFEYNDSQEAVAEATYDPSGTAGRPDSGGDPVGGQPSDAVGEAHSEAGTPHHGRSETAEAGATDSGGHGNGPRVVNMGGDGR